MFHNKNIRQLFCKMVLFRGKVSFAPNTLNNQIHTYFLAHYWAKSHMAGDKSCTYENWIKLIEDANHCATLYSQNIKIDQSKGETGIGLFNDWSVYGDSTALI